MKLRKTRGLPSFCGNQWTTPTQSYAILEHIHEKSLIRIQRYILLLSQVLKNSNPSDKRHGCHNLEKPIADIKELVLQSGKEVSKASTKVQVAMLRSQMGPVNEQLVSPKVEIIFDKEFFLQKSGFRPATPVRVVVLAPPDSRVLVLSKVSNLRSIDGTEVSYEWVKQISYDTKYHYDIFALQRKGLG
ncbi:uncharacterized protein BDV17DRAFT_213690 [Aspergillus undulatus]|uniref:uncharacterized protein n=1 Tax=Aspergillus undulatus TaxID=1810928 RepID=UPI003CCDB831